VGVLSSGCTDETNTLDYYDTAGFFGLAKPFPRYPDTSWSSPTNRGHRQISKSSGNIIIELTIFALLII
jgi:hypothetical protein